ncbi:MAG: BadF/BadG/BcrA/BcrD ATPase family protein [Bacillota bacterium]|nr:BadF/BadG/BcrA/BcrD ATPase family protein [Bacillota bacterium]
MDGGSTKTDIIIADEYGCIMASTHNSGSNYSSLGCELNFRCAMSLFVGEDLEIAGIMSAQITEVTFGVPTYGEVEETKVTMLAILHELMAGCGKVNIANDAVVCWAGSLAGKPVINIVAGTGAIGFGIDQHGNQARVGGWSTYFSDEGSCSWIGIRAMTRFFKQSDGRLPRTVLYDIFKEHFQLVKKDIYFLNNFMGRFKNNKAEYAKMQFLAYQAYQQGDESMARLYDSAAWELSEMVRALIRNLHFGEQEPVLISYSGGLFKTGETILAPLRTHFSLQNVNLLVPAYAPNVGAIIYSARSYLPTDWITAMANSLTALLNAEKTQGE